MRWLCLYLGVIALFGCAKRPFNDKPDQGGSVRQDSNPPPPASSGTPEQPPKKAVSPEPPLKPSPFFARFTSKAVRALLEECVKKDHCTTRWGPPSWGGSQDDERADPRKFQVSLERLPFRFRSAAGQDLSTEPEDAARALTALKAGVEAAVRQSGGRVVETKEEQGLKELDINGEVLREVKGRLAGVRVRYVLGRARGEVLAHIGLQKGTYIGPDPLDSFKGWSGLATVHFVETVSRQPIAVPDKGATK